MAVMGYVNRESINMGNLQDEEENRTKTSHFIRVPFFM